jgi:hypothetical protein
MHWELGDVGAVERHGARVFAPAAGKHLEEGGLAGPIGTGKTDDFCLADRKRHVMKNLATPQ